jgi:DNA-binding transcriptional MerR regulator
METDDDREVPIGEAAKIVGVSPQTLRRYQAAGRIKASTRLLGRGDRRFTVKAARALRQELEDEANRKAGGAAAG